MAWRKPDWKFKKSGFEFRICFWFFLGCLQVQNLGPTPLHHVKTTPMATTVARSGDECLKPGIGNWLLNKLLKQTFFWGKKYFFLKFHYIFHYKNFIKSLIFKIFFSACFALCWHFPRRYGVSSSICPNYLLWYI